jgi:hypothetical protein
MMFANQLTLCAPIPFLEMCYMIAGADTQLYHQTRTLPSFCVPKMQFR